MQGIKGLVMSILDYAAVTLLGFVALFFSKKMLSHPLIACHLNPNGGQAKPIMDSSLKKLDFIEFLNVTTKDAADAISTFNHAFIVDIGRESKFELLLRLNAYRRMMPFFSQKLISIATVSGSAATTSVRQYKQRNYLHSKLDAIISQEDNGFFICSEWDQTHHYIRIADVLDFAVRRLSFNSAGVTRVVIRCALKDFNNLHQQDESFVRKFIDLARLNKIVLTVILTN
jgi:hypothetical protein